MNLEYHATNKFTGVSSRIDASRVVTNLASFDAFGSVEEASFFYDWGLLDGGNAIPLDVLFTKSSIALLASNNDAYLASYYAFTVHTEKFLFNESFLARGGQSCTAPWVIDGGRRPDDKDVRFDDVGENVLPYCMKPGDLSLEGRTSSYQAACLAFQRSGNVFMNVVTLPWCKLRFETIGYSFSDAITVPSVASYLNYLITLDTRSFESAQFELKGNLSPRTIGEINSRAVLTGVLHPSLRDGDQRDFFNHAVIMGLFVPLFMHRHFDAAVTNVRSLKSIEDKFGAIRVICFHATVAPSGIPKNNKVYAC